MSETTDTATVEKRAWLNELTAQRLALKRQLFAADTQSASLSSGGGSKSYTNRSIADIKAKIAAIESEIADICRDLGIDVPFSVHSPLSIVHVSFR